MSPTSGPLSSTPRPNTTLLRPGISTFLTSSSPSANNPNPSSTAGLHSFTENYPQIKFWHDLPLWRSVWSSYEYNAPLYPRLADRPGAHRGGSPAPGPWYDVPLPAEEWMNLSALMAKLHAGTDLPTLDLRGLYALLNALERSHSPQELDDLLPAAAVWEGHKGFLAGEIWRFEG